MPIPGGVNTVYCVVKWNDSKVRNTYKNERAYVARTPGVSVEAVLLIAWQPTTLISFDDERAILRTSGVTSSTPTNKYFLPRIVFGFLWRRNVFVCSVSCPSPIHVCETPCGEREIISLRRRAETICNVFCVRPCSMRCRVFVHLINNGFYTF